MTNVIDEDLKKLFDCWADQECCQKNGFEIDHKKNGFIRDGLVDSKMWHSNKCGKKIIFLLKEAYGNKEAWNLTEWVAQKGPLYNIWKRIAEWTYGILNTDINKIATFPEDKDFTQNVANGYLRRIAVLNLKKSNGKSESKDDEIAAYGINDKDFIKKEIELIDPDVIICGGSVTINTLDEIYDKSIIKNPSNLVAFYFSDIIGGKERLFIDYYHPAVRYPKVLTYYGVVNIYQQALLLKAKFDGVRYAENNR